MLERHADQAAGLRRLFARRPQYAVVLAGETHDKAMLAIGLARSLAARGERAGEPDREHRLVVRLARQHHRVLRPAGKQAAQARGLIGVALKHEPLAPQLAAPGTAPPRAAVRRRAGGTRSVGRPA